jgi:hypothetical protein
MLWNASAARTASATFMTDPTAAPADAASHAPKPLLWRAWNAAFFLNRMGADKTALRSLKRQGRFQQMGTRPAFCGAGPLHWTPGPAVNSKGTSEEALGQFAAEKLGDMIDALKLRFCKKNSSESDRTFKTTIF